MGKTLFPRKYLAINLLPVINKISERISVKIIENYTEELGNPLEEPIWIQAATLHWKTNGSISGVSNRRIK